jgi:hypothetical protein
VLGVLAAIYLAFGLWILSRRPKPGLRPEGEARGAFHVHTNKSDGWGSLDTVAEEAAQAGLQFVVITDHNVMTPSDAGYRKGVLIVQASEVSARYGHIVALGISREVTKAEREKDGLNAIRDLGGKAVLAHPLHRRRPFNRWKREDWLGMEVVSGDTLLHQAVKPGNWWRLLLASLALPWDGAQAMLLIYAHPAAELRAFDEINSSRGRHHLLFCSVDAHGWPSYRSVFEAFSMHVPVKLTGDGAVDVAAVMAALTNGSASCVFDGVAPGWGISLALDEVRPTGEGPPVSALRLDAPEGKGAHFQLFHDGQALGPIPPGIWSTGTDRPLEPGAYRVEGTWEGRPWVLTNPVRVN